MHTFAATIPAPVTPPNGDKIMELAGWVMFGVGLALVLAFAVGLAHLAWSHFNHRSGGSAMTLGIVLLCGVAFGSIGAIMGGLF